MRAGVGVDELDEVLLGAGSLVRQRLGGPLLEVLDGRVGLDALLFGEGFAGGGFGVDLGDQNARFGRKGVGKGFPDGGEALAVLNAESASRTSERVSID